MLLNIDGNESAGGEANVGEVGIVCSSNCGVEFGFAQNQGSFVIAERNRIDRQFSADANWLLNWWYKDEGFPLITYVFLK